MHINVKRWESEKRMYIGLGLVIHNSEGSEQEALLEMNPAYHDVEYMI